MIARCLCLSIAVILVIACNSPFDGANRASTSPSASKSLYLGSLGSAGCKPGAAFHGWPVQGGFQEVGVDSGRGSLWALFFTPVPPPTGKDIKVVWRMTGSGDFTFSGSDSSGQVIHPTRDPQPHGVNGSNWNHPGFEVGTGFNFPHSGCWNIHVSRSDVAGDLWLEVAS